MRNECLTIIQSRKHVRGVLRLVILAPKASLKLRRARQDEMPVVSIVEPYRAIFFINLSIILSIFILFSQPAFCMNIDTNAEQEQTRTEFGILSILPREIISHVICQNIENCETPIEAYQTCDSFKLNKKFLNMTIDMIYEKFKNKFPSKLHIAVSANANKWVSDNYKLYLDKINIPDSNGFTPWPAQSLM